MEKETKKKGSLNIGERNKEKRIAEYLGKPQRVRRLTTVSIEKRDYVRRIAKNWRKPLRDKVY